MILGQIFQDFLIIQFQEPSLDVTTPHCETKIQMTDKAVSLLIGVTALCLVHKPRQGKYVT